VRRVAFSIGAKLILLSTFVSLTALALAAVTLIVLQSLGSNGDVNGTLAYALLVGTVCGISVRSQLRVGSQFVVRLPVVSQKVEEPVG
jgi:FtsH-binding integral membrane protein